MAYAPANEVLIQYIRDMAAALTSGGAGGTSNNAAVPVQAGVFVVKASSGYLGGALVTTAGTSTAMTFYDNATAASGTILGIVPSGATVGQFFPFNMPAKNGITASGSATNPAVTVSFS